jgi:hypothetical protein
MLTRIFLALMGLMFIVFGAFALLQPQALVASLGITVGGPNGDYELRGIYGGVSLAAGLLCFASVLREGLRPPALIFLLVYFGGYVFARAAALLFGPAPTSVYGPFVAFEVVCFALTVAALIAHNRKERGA